MTFEGKTVATQRVRVDTEVESTIETQPFVWLRHQGGDGTVDCILLTPDEARFVRDALNTIYPLNT
jgi:hypothetical protein